MASAPQTWTILTNVQSIIQAEVLVSSASPYTAFSTADAATYGATNAIYIGTPKDVKNTAYPNQCWIIPPKPEDIYHYTGMGATGGLIYQDQEIEILHLFDYQSNGYAAIQACINATDALVPVLMRHVDTGYGPTVKTATLKRNSGEYGFYDAAGRVFFSWHATLHVKQYWGIAGGVVS